MQAAGIWMLAAVAVTMVATGLPAWITLTGVSLAFAAAGILAGQFDASLLAALHARLLGLLENDLLQALPLYVLMGALMQRMPLADILFKVGSRGLARTGCGAPLAALGLGVLFAPMSGSVGASVAMLGRIVPDGLRAGNVPPERTLALVCASATLGVIVPPSLVLILLGDAMMRAHTEASHVAGFAGRIVNTQDVFHAALIPGAILVALFAAVTWWAIRVPPAPGTARPGAREVAVAGATLLALVALLGGVALGYLFAVEAAAAGAIALLAAGLATGTLGRAALDEVLRDALAITGSLFALLLAATLFTLVQRAFGTDRWIAELLARFPLGPTALLAAGLAMLGACALVLDAFEMIFVVVPLIAPPLLTRVPDATWVAVLILLMLQASFLAPPFGYAVLMARSRASQPVGTLSLARALLPYVLAQALVLALVIAFPGILWRDAPAADTLHVPASDREASDLLERQLDAPRTP